MPYITIPQLRAKLRPLVNARLAGGSNEMGERPYADIHAAWHVDSDEARCHYSDCDIRGLTGAGIERCWDGKGEAIRWDLIRSVTIGEYLRGFDGRLHYNPRTTYHVIQQRKPAQVAA